MLVLYFLLISNGREDGPDLRQFLVFPQPQIQGLLELLQLASGWVDFAEIKIGLADLIDEVEVER